MPNLLAQLNSLQGSYSGAFVLFWGLMLIACAGVWLLEWRKNSVASQIESVMFWAFGLAMVAFAALRPIGIALDDLAYLEIFKTVCPSLECGQWIQSPRDWGWYTLTGFLKSFWPGPRVMLMIAALALVIKLWVVFKLSKRPLLALIFFTGVFYQAQDITAFRVSLSLAAFMLAIYLLVRHHPIFGGGALFIPGVFHKQALLSPLLLLSVILRRWYTVFVVLAVLPICLLFLGLSHQGYREIIPYQNLPWVQLVIQQGLDSYIAAGQAGFYDKIRIMPYSYLSLIALVIFGARAVFLSDRTLFQYCAMSMVITCWLTWLFAGWQEPQARFFEYFALPAVLLVGNFKNNVWVNGAVIAVSALFVVRYNVLHPLLSG